MSDGENPKSWWHTLPGVITSLTAAITALAGLIVAIQQTGWFGPQTSPVITAPSTATPTAPTGAAGPAAPALDPTIASQPSVAVGPDTYAVGLPALRDYRLGAATFTLLRAEVSPRTTAKNALQIRVRMTNHDRFDANFWDQSFRLLLNGVPMAPESGLNELVRAESAQEGDVLFVIPHGTTEGTLRITHADETTEVPLALGPPS
jgi:hypothetical protein